MLEVLWNIHNVQKILSVLHECPLWVREIRHANFMDPNRCTEVVITNLHPVDFTNPLICDTVTGSNLLCKQHIVLNHVFF